MAPCAGKSCAQPDTLVAPFVWTTQSTCADEDCATWEHVGIGSRSYKKTSPSRGRVVEEQRGIQRVDDVTMHHRIFVFADFFVDSANRYGCAVKRNPIPVMRFSILVNPGLSVRMSTHLDGSGMHFLVEPKRVARCLLSTRELGAAADRGRR